MRNGKIYQKALEFSEEVHRGSSDDNGFPFVGHSASVGRNICSDGFDKAEVVLGFIHDTLKKDKIDITNIENRFGEKVAEMAGEYQYRYILDPKARKEVVGIYEQEDTEKYDISGEPVETGFTGLHRAVKDTLEFHRDQFRKVKDVPYSVHPIGVGRTLAKYECDEDVIKVGLFHDVIENTDVGYKEIEDSYNEKVAGIVEELTDNPEDSWEVRKRKNFEHLENCSRDVRLVGMADKLDNLEALQKDYRRLGEDTWSKFNRPKKFHGWYFGNLKRVFANFNSSYPEGEIYDRFREVYDELFEEHIDLKKIG